MAPQSATSGEASSAPSDSAMARASERGPDARGSVCGNGLDHPQRRQRKGADQHDGRELDLHNDRRRQTQRQWQPREQGEFAIARLAPAFGARCANLGGGAPWQRSAISAIGAARAASEPNKVACDIVEAGEWSKARDRPKIAQRRRAAGDQPNDVRRDERGGDERRQIGREPNGNRRARQGG